MSQGDRGESEVGACAVKYGMVGERLVSSSLHAPSRPLPGLLGGSSLNLETLVLRVGSIESLLVETILATLKNALLVLVAAVGFFVGKRAGCRPHARLCQAEARPGDDVGTTCDYNCGHQRPCDLLCRRKGNHRPGADVDTAALRGQLVHCSSCATYVTPTCCVG
eukprot:362867-Chlamydomonas_euryale.AAC.2